MAFTKLSDYSYIALSGDVKTTVGIIAGARLIEYDTDSQFIFDGTAWREANNILLDSVAAIQVAIEALRIDAVSGALVVASLSHAETHSGKSFIFYHSSSTPTNTGERTIIAFKTPDTDDRIHMLYQGLASAAAHFHILEGINEGAAGGTEVTPVNRERNSAMASLMKSARVGTVNRLATYVAADAANITGGTSLITESVGATGQGQQTTGGETQDFGVLILKQNTAYAYVMENLDDNNNVHSLLLSWHEEG